MYKKITKELTDFIEKSPTSFHAVKNISEELLKNGFSELFEFEDWNLNKGGKYFVTRNQSSIIAFKIPENPDCFMIAASHTDSPCFKIKPSPELESEGVVKLNIEGYGGMIKESWFDRPLSVAGRIVTETEEGIKSELINIDRDLVVIPSLAIHMGKVENINIQKDLLPLAGTQEGVFSRLFGDNIGCDLFLYNRMKASFWGVDNEYFSAPRIDNLQSAFSTMRGFLNADNIGAVSVFTAFDNEEVGSGTKQGAKSTFLSDVLERICYSTGITKDGYKRMLASSFMLSADNAHAAHPNYPEKADPINRPRMNGGIVIKYNANQKYTTDSVSEALFKKICKNAGVPYQTYVNRSDVAGGSTLGNLASESVSVNTVDIGIAQLAMHSSYETAGVKDTYYMVKAAEEFFETSLVAVKDGILLKNKHS
ncbi:MAG: M18 family aminopeptidase [Clostridia bacterium]|nr:M18 family aminopeptidase [Clostridia bacterium]